MGATYLCDSMMGMKDPTAGPLLFVVLVGERDAKYNTIQ